MTTVENATLQGAQGAATGAGVLGPLGAVLGFGLGVGSTLLADGAPEHVGLDSGTQGYLALVRGGQRTGRITVVVSLSEAIDGRLQGPARNRLRSQLQAAGIDTNRVSGRRQWILGVPLVALPALAASPHIAGIELHAETPPPRAAPASAHAPNSGGGMVWVAGAGAIALVLIALAVN